MPLPLGHLAIGLATSETLQTTDQRTSRWKLCLAVAILANLPDVDVLLGLVWQGNGSLFHRGPTHSLAFALLAGYIASQLWRLGGHIPRLDFTLCFSLVFSHVMADLLLTTAPVSLFWPLHVYWSPGMSDWGTVVHAVVFQSVQDAGILLACAIYLSILKLVRGNLKHQHMPARLRQRIK